MYRYRFIPNLLVWAAVAALHAGCENRAELPSDPPVTPYLTLGSELPAFDARGGSAVLTFATNEAWTIDVVVPDGEPDGWFAVAPPSGEAGEQLSVTVLVQPNGTYVGREADLVLRTESRSERVAVRQLKKNAILLGENRCAVDSGKQTLAVEVQSNVAYTVRVEQGAGWIEEIPESRAATGLEQRTHRFEIAANTQPQERTGIIVFTDKDAELSDELTVVQAAWVDPDPDRTALTALYDAGGGSGWTRSDNWCSDKPLSEWYGVETDTEGRVVALRLPDNNLRGAVLEQVGALTRLRHLDLSRNALEEELTYLNADTNGICSYLDDLLDLETVNLSNNRLTGTDLPGLWYKMKRLQTVDLSFNRLQGHVFPQLWARMFEGGRYVDLILNCNYLYGSIPDVVQNHPQWGRLALQIMRQYYRDETGTITNPGITYNKEIVLPDFTFTDLRDGSVHSIEDVYGRNKLTMLLHWDPTQEESRTFMETVVRRVHTLFGPQGFAVVAIVPEGDAYREAAQQYLAAHEVAWHVVTDYADADGRRINLPSLPCPGYQMVDGSGCVLRDIFDGAYNKNIIEGEPDVFDLKTRPFNHSDYLSAHLRPRFGKSVYRSVDYTMDKQYETLQTATRGKGIDLVLVGDAFTDIDIETGFYRQVMEFAMESFFALEPTKSYREYFNVYMAYAVSRDAYMGYFDSSDGQTALGTLTDGPRIGCIKPRLELLGDYVRACPIKSYDACFVTVVLNNYNSGATYYEPSGPTYAYSGYPWGSHATFRGSISHESVGHGFALLADEYWELTEAQQEKVLAKQAEGYFLNISVTNDRDLVPWAHLIGHPRFPHVGVYGSGGDAVWRSEKPVSTMRDLFSNYFNAASREAIVKRIMELAGEEYTFEKFLQKDSDEGRPESGWRAQRTMRHNAEEPRVHNPPAFVE